MFFAADLGEKYNFMSSMRVLTFEQMVAQSTQRPSVILVYASWCPSCKGMIAEMNEFAKNNVGKLRIAILSIDVDPADAEAFLSKQDPIYVESYAVDNGRKYYADIGDAMRRFGFAFTGGVYENDGVGKVFKQTAVPHLVVIKGGRPEFENAGAIKRDALKQLLTKYANDAK